MSGCGYVNPKDLNMAFNPTTTTTISGSRSPGQNGPDTKFSAAAMPNMSGNGHGGKVDSRMVLTPAITPDEPGPIHTSTGTFGTTNSQSSPAFRPSNGQSSSVSGFPPPTSFFGRTDAEIYILTIAAAIFNNFQYPVGTFSVTCKELNALRNKLLSCPIVQSNPSAEGERIANLLREYTCTVHIPDQLYLAQCVWENWNATLILCRTIRPLLPPWSSYVVFLETLTAQYLAATEYLDLGPISMSEPPVVGPRYAIQALTKRAQAKEVAKFNQFSRLDPVNPLKQFNRATQAAMFNQRNQVDPSNQLNQLHHAGRATEATEASQASQLVSQANINSRLDPEDTEAELKSSN